jgi:hypothetical protein
MELFDDNSPSLRLVTPCQLQKLYINIYIYDIEDIHALI